MKHLFNNLTSLHSEEGQETEFYFDELGTYCNLGGYVGSSKTGKLINFSGNKKFKLDIESIKLCEFESYLYLTVQTKGDTFFVGNIWNRRFSEQELQITEYSDSSISYFLEFSKQSSSPNTFKYYKNENKIRVDFNHVITEEINNTYTFEFSLGSAWDTQLFTLEGNPIEGIDLSRSSSIEMFQTL